MRAYTDDGALFARFLAGRGMAEEVMRRYRGQVLYGPFASLDPGDMQALEAEIGYPIPAAYRAFLEVAHGGSLDYSVRVPPGPDGEIIAFSDGVTPSGPGSGWNGTRTTTIPAPCSRGGGRLCRGTCGPSSGVRPPGTSG